MRMLYNDSGEPRNSRTFLDLLSQQSTNHTQQQYPCVPFARVSETVSRNDPPQSQRYCNGRDDTASLLDRVLLQPWDEHSLKHSRNRQEPQYGDEAEEVINYNIAGLCRSPKLPSQILNESNQHVPSLLKLPHPSKLRNSGRHSKEHIKSVSKESNSVLHHIQQMRQKQQLFIANIGHSNKQQREMYKAQGGDTHVTSGLSSSTIQKSTDKRLDFSQSEAFHLEPRISHNHDLLFNCESTHRLCDDSGYSSSNKGLNFSFNAGQFNFKRCSTPKASYESCRPKQASWSPNISLLTNSHFSERSSSLAEIPEWEKADLPANSIDMATMCSSKSQDQIHELADCHNGYSKSHHYQNIFNKAAETENSNLTALSPEKNPQSRSDCYEDSSLPVKSPERKKAKFDDNMDAEWQWKPYKTCNNQRFKPTAKRIDLHPSPEQGNNESENTQINDNVVEKCIPFDKTFPQLATIIDKTEQNESEE